MSPAQLEWEMTMEVAQHFNDLLMRLRSFGLPLVVIVAGAAFGLSIDVQVQDVPNWAVAALLTANAIVVALVLVFVWTRPGWGAAAPDAEEYRIRGDVELHERLMWCLPLVFAAAGAASYWWFAAVDRVDLTSEVDYSAGPMVLLLAVAILVVLYALDRFYYYKLLLGAVNRASQLEAQMQFRLTDTITGLTAPRQSATIVTLLYFLPGLVAYSIMLAFLIVNPAIK
jgi:hypothetical protein